MVAFDRYHAAAETRMTGKGSTQLLDAAVGPAGNDKGGRGLSREGHQGKSYAVGGHLRERNARQCEMVGADILMQACGFRAVSNVSPT